MGAFCTIFRAWPVGAGLGANFGRDMTENGQNLNYSLFLGLSAAQNTGQALGRGGQGAAGHGGEPRRRPERPGPRLELGARVAAAMPAALKSA